MDQPRNVRIQALKNAKKRKERQANEGGKAKEAEAKRAALLEAVKKASAKAYREVVPQLEVRVGRRR